jgi:alanine dehydrogenase
VNIGIPREPGHGERRLGLSPGGAETLVADGHRVYVQSSAGEEKGFADMDYAAAGARVVHSMEEILERSTLVLNVGPPRQAELPFLTSKHIWAGYLHLAVAPITLLDKLLDKNVTLIDYQTIETDDGELPAQKPVSEVAGRMSVYVAAMLLQNNPESSLFNESTGEGLGILLSGVPGVPPADIVILGAGAVGANAARGFAGLGARVTLLDSNLSALKSIDDEFRGQVVTMAAHAQNIRKAVSFADVLVGGILIPGGRAPRLVTREMVRSMRPGSVILDVSIDQGGCVETSHLTSFAEPTYIEEGVIHYCVPNMASAVGRTATYAMTNALLPFIRRLAEMGIAEATRQDTALARGVNLYGGHLTNRQVAASFHRAHKSLISLLRKR